jgi:hypothetical protein
VTEPSAATVTSAAPQRKVSALTAGLAPGRACDARGNELVSIPGALGALA